MNVSAYIVFESVIPYSCRNYFTVIKGNFMKKRYIFSGLIVVCVVMLIITSFCSFYKVEGDSMNPALVNNDVVYVRKTKSFKQGDLIAFNYNNKLLVRRVIALGGDKVNIDQNGYIFVNDKKLEENYIQSRKDNPLRDEVFPYTVPQGHIFVLGDNRTHAIDSRMRDLGAIDQNKIIGKVVLRIYPVIRFSVL